MSWLPLGSSFLFPHWVFTSDYLLICSLYTYPLVLSFRPHCFSFHLEYFFWINPTSPKWWYTETFSPVFSLWAQLLLLNPILSKFPECDLSATLSLPPPWDYRSSAINGSHGISCSSGRKYHHRQWQLLAASHSAYHCDKMPASKALYYLSLLFY